MGLIPIVAAFITIFMKMRQPMRTHGAPTWETFHTELWMTELNG